MIWVLHKFTPERTEASELMYKERYASHLLILYLPNKKYIKKKEQ